MDKLFHYHKYPRGMWMRLFGYGISVEDNEMYPPLYSVRNGYKKSWLVGGWRILLLGRG